MGMGFGSWDEDLGDERKCTCSCHQCNIGSWEKKDMQKRIAELEAKLAKLREDFDKHPR